MSNLFFDGTRGLRHWFGSFATQTYLTLACYTYGDFAGDPRAIEMANSAVRKLIALQGPNGEWPWFFHVPSGTVVDFYEIYSVHQYGMAPAFLEHAERHGVPGARDALIKGFKWVLGENRLRQPMLVPELHMSIRSQVRELGVQNKILRLMRAICNGLLHRAASPSDPTSVKLRLECRSYELGWILWSFGQRSDLSELTHHRLFVDALPIAPAQEKQPLISVIIPHLNQPEGLDKCLASLDAQTLEPSCFEVIVVDNGSISLPDTIIARHPDTRLLQESEPGPGPARNCGVRAARGDILCFIDADCRPHPTWLEVALQTLSSAPERTILAGDVQIWRRPRSEHHGNRSV